MPRGDGTGPMGMGPMTGRAAGFCAGYGVPGYVNPFGGRGFGGGLNRGFAPGLGRGGGWGRGFAGPAAYGGPAPFALPTREQELEALKGQAESLSGALEQIRARLAELEKSEAE